MIIGENSIIDYKISKENLLKIANIEWVHNITFKDNLLDYVLSVADILPDTTKYYISLDINKLYDLNILKNIYEKNPNIYILYGYEDVSIDVFIYTCKKLDELVEPIKSLPLSPFEKFIYVFNATSKFRKYKYKEGLEDKSGGIFDLFESDNNLIVCLGFSKILDELCKRIGLHSKRENIYLCENKENGKTETHSRNIGKIIDKKYNIDGIYIFDSTLSNDTENDLYVTSCMTPYESLGTYFDNVKYGTYLDILSAQSYDEFIYVISRDSINKYRNFSEALNILLEFYPILDEILSMDIYNNFKNIDNPNKDDYYKLFANEEFMQKLYIFIKEKCNKIIDGNTIVKAACNVKKELEPSISNEALEKFKKKILETNSNYHDELYVYVEEYDEATVIKYINDRRNTFK